MKTPMMIAGLSLCIGTFASEAMAQGRAEDLRSLDDLFAGTVKFRIDRDERLVADLFDEGGHYREDVVYIEYLDPEAFIFSPEESAVVLKCGDANPQCIEKEVFKSNVIRHTGRSTLPVPPGDPEGARAIELLRQLVRGVQLAQAERTNETPGRPKRKN